MDAGEVALGVAAGIDDFIMKPFDRETLSAKLADLNTSRARAQPPIAAA
jgi:DNA-binding response OmpR family regulator